LFRRRVVELKHGRVSMAAVLGYWVAEFWHPLYDGKVEPGLKALGQVPAAAWLQILASIAVVELTVGKQDYESKAPGDLGFGLAFNPFPNDQEKFADLQLKELKNGRLAMLAIMGMMVQEGLTGQTTFAQLSAGNINPF
jgi:light-harvesting complex I chlorophyll a/b binding protein 1